MTDFCPFSKTQYNYFLNNNFLLIIKHVIKGPTTNCHYCESNICSVAK